jgi:hypothetical protein
MTAALPSLIAAARSNCLPAAPRGQKAHGFTTEQVVELVRAGLATAASQGVRAGRERMEVAVLRITAEGRLALAGMK